ncbi:MAG: LLM class flavin-dependent oxidoreductase [Acidimicrobiales bacterium]
MDLSVCVASNIRDIDYVVEAERLGFARAWFADSQMIWSDPYACLALAASRTSRIGLGTGVAVAATRPAPVTAASIATINALAPGRTFLGVGTGNTAMRIMGHKPMTIAEFDDYLTTLAPLLRGEAAEFSWRGRTRPIRHLMADTDLGFVDVETPIPLYVSGFGPKSLAVAGAHGDGAVLSVPPVPGAMERVWTAMERGAAGADRSLDRASFHACTLTTICVTEPGEAHDSDRVRHQVGAFAIASLHYAMDQWRNYGKAPTSPAVLEVWDDYLALVEQTPPERRHLRVHEGHNCWVVPDEERFLTRALIDQSCLVGTTGELIERLGALHDEGLDEVMVLPPLEPRYDVLRSIGEQIIPTFS